MSKYAKGSKAFGFCDRTGFRYPLEDLVEEYVQGKPTGLRVGRDMVDPDHPQNWLGKMARAGDDAQALKNPRPDTSLAESRRMSSWNPVGVGNMVTTEKVGTVSVNVSKTLHQFYVTEAIYDPPFDNWDSLYGQVPNSHTDAVYQTFVTPSSITHITGVMVRARKAGTVAGSFYVSLYSVSNGRPDGTIADGYLYKSDLYDPTGLLTSYSDCLFAVDWAVSASTEYAIVFGGTDISDQYSTGRIEILSAGPGEQDVSFAGYTGATSNFGATWQRGTVNQANNDISLYGYGVSGGAAPQDFLVLPEV